MYGNADLTMQQIRNQNQTFNDQIFNYQAAIKSMEKEKTEKEKESKELKKKAKTLEKQLNDAKLAYEMAKDDYDDNENKNKQIEHTIKRTHSLEKMKIGQKYEGDINAMRKKETELDNDIHLKAIQLKRQEGVIARKAMAGKLKEKQEELDTLTAEYKGVQDYINSDEFQNPISKMEEIFKKEMHENDLKKYEETIQKLRQEIIEANKYVDEHPDDYAAIQTQLTKKIEELQNVKIKAQKHNDNLQQKLNHIDYLKQTQENLRKDINDLTIKQNEMDLNLEYNKEQDINKNIDELIKQKTNLSIENEKKQHELNLMKETREQQRKNNELKSQVKTFDETTKNEKFKEQDEKMLALETQYNYAVIEGEKYKQIYAKQKQLDALQLANAAKEQIINSSNICGQPFDSAAETATTSQVEAILDSNIQQQKRISQDLDTQEKRLNDNFEEEEEENNDEFVSNANNGFNP